MMFNVTESIDLLIQEEIRCFKLMEEERDQKDVCERSWDGLLCWPPSRPGAAYLPCFEELHGIKYDTSQNATRWCHPNGTWANYSNYTKCSDLGKPAIEFEDGVEVTTMIYSIGYGLSLVALCLAVYIFIYYKELRCLRNTIHTNLMCTYILADFMWILNYSLQISVQTDFVPCVLLVILLHYFHLTNFFWMFVEGFYLYMLVVKTFTQENIKLRVYLAIGWGAPVLIVITWWIARFITDEQRSDSQIVMDPFQKGCHWMMPNMTDWIYQTPAIIVLVINLMFLVMIMLVLITKLRSATNVETQQYRKAAKALLVLIPLLGITYILFIVGPSKGPYYANLYEYVRSILISTQGLMVALFYCFLNTEVQNTVRHHLIRWKEARDIGVRRLYSKHEACTRIRGESTASEATTLTLGYSGAHRNTNGPTANTIRASVSPCLDTPEHAV
ncbi:diuretic hormone receptor-like isoform X2 [Cimex lectularius]|uniref:Diuretic hormone receptor n=1 Tax=Cimex lectularius TaxID=79782 RepID=A0A8I6ST82_CIMLE|nr:diuretic hormone receptor-like isoform X2 [Cimex lectularius]